MKLNFNTITNKLPHKKAKVYLPPESLVYTGDIPVPIKIKIIQYNENGYLEVEITEVEDLTKLNFTDNITWLQIYGLHDEDLIKQIGDYFKIHNLVLEDILHVDQRPKIENYDDYLFLVIKSFSAIENDLQLDQKQISCILSENYFITFLEKQTNFFDPIIDHIKNNRNNIKTKKPDFLLYIFLDLIVDSYFLLLQGIEDNLYTLENDLIGDNNDDITNQLHKLTSNISCLHRYIFPVVEITKNIVNLNSKLIHDTTFYFRDLYDHTYRIVDSLESYREMTFNLLQIYLSEVSTRMNEIMKVLTIIATIFIPLTFIVGVYGMNFKYMPELEYKYGYFIVWGVMVLIAILLIFYFKKKKWL